MTFGASLHAFAEGFFGFLFNIDLLHPGHFGFLLLLIFLGLGMRPSYIGEKKQEKVDMLYDLKNIWSLITHKPLYLIILFMAAYIFFYISLFFNGDWFVALFSMLGWASIISIVAIIIANILLFLIKITDEIPGIWKFIPYLVMPISYILARVLFFYVSLEHTNFISLLLMTILTAVVTLLLLKYKTNKFKSKRKIKMSKKKNRGKTDEG
jgi:hypothetical protein